VILDAAFEDERLFEFGVLVEGDVGARFELQEAGHLAALRIFVQHLDRDFLEAGRLPFHLGRSDVGRAADRGNEAGRSFEDVIHGLLLWRASMITGDSAALQRQH
jgi:hypothetical protein